MGEIKFFTSLVLIILFAIAVVGYAVNFGADNDSAVKLSDDPTMNSLSDTLEAGLIDTSTKMNESSTGFFDAKEEGTGNDVVSVTGGQFKVGISSVMSTMGAIFSMIKLKVFGGNPLLAVFISALVFVLSFIAIRYIWKTWKGGNPD